MSLPSYAMVILNSFDHYVRRLKRCRDLYHSRRRLFILLLIVSLMIMYIGPSIFRLLWGSSPDLSDHNSLNLDRELRQFRNEARRFSSSISLSYTSAEDEEFYEKQGIRARHFAPYVGNGGFGLPLDGQSLLYIKGKRALNLALDYHPLVAVDTFGASKQTATVIRFVEGSVQKLTSFSYLQAPTTVSETIYAHRTIPSLLVQEIRIANPTNVPLIVRLSRLGWNGRGQLKAEATTLKTHDNMVYTLYHSELQLKDSPRSIGFVILAAQLPSTIEIAPNAKRTLIVPTFINYTEPVNSVELNSRWAPLKASTKDIAAKVLSLLPGQLYAHHQKAWARLWESGFGISLSRANGALNGDVINATIYYILSQKSTYSTMSSDTTFPHSSTELDVSKSSALLSRPDRCYAGLPTLQASALWSNLDSFNDIQRITSLWLLTLEKNGCNNLLAAGAEGTMQAILLSFVAMQFHKNHLEMGIHPKELHRDYYLRRIRYNNATLLNVTMSVGEDNKASIYVSLDKNAEDKVFFACDAGCLDTPVQLSTVERQLPVKITEPLTAILYVTSDKQHIQELKHAIHVKEVAVAPAHEHHIIALHRHGHQLGGLPVLFWITIFVLVVIFHVFLAKLVINEYCSGGPSGNSRYAV